MAGAGVALSAPHCVDTPVISYLFSLKGFAIFCSGAKQGKIFGFGTEKKKLRDSKDASNTRCLF